jgi:hypothetical protein
MLSFKEMLNELKLSPLNEIVDKLKTNKFFKETYWSVGGKLIATLFFG